MEWKLEITPYTS